MDASTKMQPQYFQAVFGGFALMVTDGRKQIQTDRWTDKQANGQTDGQENGQTDAQTDGQTSI